MSINSYSDLLKRNNNEAESNRKDAIIDEDRY